MPVKILGQTISVAPSTAATTINLVGDPSFASSISAGSLSTTANSSTTTTNSFNGSTRWHYTSANTTANQLTNATAQSVTAPFGDSGSAIGVYFNGGGTVSFWLGYGYNASTSAAIYNQSSPNAFSTSTAIPVSANTIYYWAFSYYVNNTGSSSITAYGQWWDINGTHISQWNPTVNRTSGAFTRTSVSQTSPSNAAYFTFYYEFLSQATRTHLIDGVSFATGTTLYSTFTEPKLPSVAVTTSPFDKKTDGYVTETATAISTLSYAGPIQTLYTCPAGSSAVVSTITATNLSANSTTFRLIVQKNGESLATKHFIVLDAPLGATTTEAFTIGITLAAGDILKVAADTSTVSFSAFGNES